jgi:cellulose synthase/poly-beta-1,6-N-acetylglucosamine synthase-like glycosyltransferase
MAYSVTQAALMFRLAVSALFRRGVTTPPAPEIWPKVVLQLPLYNEKYVVARLLEAVSALDYQSDRLVVQVLDDSTDDTTEMVAGLVASCQHDGLSIQHIRRPVRNGFKAGALAYGLTLVPDAEYAAILDADFIPAPDFLRRILPYFSTAPQVAFVQGRWGHLNDDASWLTRAQALNIDAYYTIEQAARSVMGTVMSFNGTGGVWCIAAIQAAGGWQADTLTEDFDLSYRARLAGWRGVYAPDVVVAGELPPQIEAYKRQQSRWATGSTQVLIKLGRTLLVSKLSLADKLLGLLQMSQYLPHPLILVMLLLAPWVILTGGQAGLTFAPLAFFALLQPILHLTAQRRLYPQHWLGRIFAFPVVMVLGLGLLWNNSRAAYNAYQSWRQRRELEFVRTPKFAAQGNSWTGRAYALNPLNGQAWSEVGLAVYASLSYLLALRFNSASAPWLLTYVIALGCVAVWGWSDQWRMRHPAPQTAATSLGVGD